jgi:DNA-binding GntR family transcriptional regulator
VLAAIRDAIIARRLRPGQRLRELELAELFGVSRTIIRGVLQQLASAGLVRIEANKGASVDLPSHDEIAGLFQARAIIEMGIVARLCSTRQPDLIKRLRAHIELEQSAIDASDYRQAITLLGEFHILLAKAAENEPVNAFYRSLVLRTSLIVSAIEAAADSTCRTEEHSDLLDLIERGDVQAASMCVWNHLQEIETSLRVAAESGEQDYHPLQHLFLRESLAK